ncbi:MAG: MFS transporter [Thermoplasmatales archaeon]
MFDESQERIDSSFNFLLVSRATRSIALVFVSLAFSLYLNELGYSLVFIGVAFLAIVAFNMLISLFIGMMGDRIGYSRALLIGETFAVVGTAGLSFSTNILVIIISAVLAGVSGTAGAIRGAFSPGMTAYIASNWSNELARVQRLARVNIVASLFSIVGGIMLYTHDYLTPYFGKEGTFRFLFLISFFLLIISAVSLLFLRERRRPRKTTSIMKADSAKYMIRILIPNSVNGAAIGLAIPLLPLWFHLRFDISISTVGEVFTYAYAATALGSYLSGKYFNSHKISAIFVSSVTRFFQGFLLIAIAFSPLAVVAAGLYVIRSTVAGIGAPMRSAISVRGIGHEDYGTASSIEGTATRGSQMTSGLSGYLMDLYYSLPIFLGGAIQATGAVIYYKLIRSWEINHQSSEKKEFS